MQAHKSIIIQGFKRAINTWGVVDLRDWWYGGGGGWNIGGKAMLIASLNKSVRIDGIWCWLDWMQCIYKGVVVFKEVKGAAWWQPEADTKGVLVPMAHSITSTPTPMMNVSKHTFDFQALSQQTFTTIYLLTTTNYFLTAHNTHTMLLIWYLWWLSHYYYCQCNYSYPISFRHLPPSAVICVVTLACSPEE